MGRKSKAKANKNNQQPPKPPQNVTQPVPSSEPKVTEVLPTPESAPIAQTAEKVEVVAIQESHDEPQEIDETPFQPSPTGKKKKNRNRNKKKNQQNLQDTEDTEAVSEESPQKPPEVAKEGQSQEQKDEKPLIAPSKRSQRNKKKNAERANQEASAENRINDESKDTFEKVNKDNVAVKIDEPQSEIKEKPSETTPVKSNAKQETKTPDKNQKKGQKSPKTDKHEGEKKIEAGDINKNTQDKLPEPTINDEVASAEAPKVDNLPRIDEVKELAKLVCATSKVDVPLVDPITIQINQPLVITAEPCKDKPKEPSTEATLAQLIELVSNTEIPLKDVCPIAGKDKMAGFQKPIAETGAALAELVNAVARVDLPLKDIVEPVMEEKGDKGPKGKKGKQPQQKGQEAKKSEAKSNEAKKDKKSKDDKEEKDKVEPKETKEVSQEPAKPLVEAQTCTEKTEAKDVKPAVVQDTKQVEEVSESPNLKSVVEESKNTETPLVGKKSEEPKKEDKSVKTKEVKPQQEPAKSKQAPEKPQQKPAMPKQEPATPKQGFATPKQEPATPKQEPATLKQEPATPKQGPATPKQEPSTPKQEPTTPKQESATPKQESATPKQESATPKQGPATPKQEPATPKQEPATPKQEPTTPKQEPSTPKQEPTTPKQELATPKQEPTTPKQELATPKQEPVTPKQEPATPKQEPATPKQEPATPKQEPATPKQEPATPKQEPATPKQEPATPKQEPTTPKQELATPKQESATPKQEPATPKQEPATPKQGSATPKQDPATPKQEPAKSDQGPEKLQQAATPKQELATAKQEPATPKQEPETPKQELATAKQEPATPKQEPAKSKQEPATSKQEPAKTQQEPEKPKPEPSKPQQEPVKPKQEAAKPKQEFEKPKQEPAKPQQESKKPETPKQDTPPLEMVADATKKSQNTTPTTKKNKEDANLKEANEKSEAKAKEVPEKNPQEKMDAITFVPDKLIDILDTKMETPANTGAIKKTPKQKESSEMAAQTQISVKPGFEDKPKGAEEAKKQGQQKQEKSGKTSPQKSPKKPQIPPKPEHLTKKTPQAQQKPQESKEPTQAPKKLQLMSDDEEEFIEYKFTPRQVFLATICQVCKLALQNPNPCPSCLMVSYCSEAHAKEDAVIHQQLCRALQEIARKRGGHVYNNAKILSNDDFRNLRVHTLNLCESLTQRPLQPFEKEILLFPRICCTATCREWRPPLLVGCQKCGQVSYCKEQPGHLPEDHQRWCPFFLLYQKLIVRQKNTGRIEPSLPSRIFLQRYELPSSMDEVFKELYKNNPAIKDDCTYATLTQLATAPLTAFNAVVKTQLNVQESLTIHLVGAELQFEGDTLDKWEAFFLHLIPQVLELRVVFIGPELNSENLPLDILSRIRMCRTCRQACRGVKFDFQCGKLYHDYAKQPAFTKPDLICFFNPGLYRATGFSGLDTWPDTIKAATSLNCPIVVTSYTEVESPQDLAQLHRDSTRPLNLIHAPAVNPFSSQRPERNFISDEVSPMIFKNYFVFIVS